MDSLFPNLQNYFDSINKCKVKGQIYNITSKKIDSCKSSLEIYLNDNNHYYKITASSKDIKNTDPICIIDTDFPIVESGSYIFPKIGDNFKGLANKEDTNYPLALNYEFLYDLSKDENCKENVTKETYLQLTGTGNQINTTKIQIDPQDKCKAHGIIDDVIIPENMAKTYVNTEIFFHNETNSFNAYFMNDVSKNDLGYNLSGENYPKVGNEIYTIQDYWNNYVISVGKQEYENNNSLPDCSYNDINSTLSSSNIVFTKNQCKLEAIITNIKTKNNDNCFNDLTIELKNNNYTYTIFGKQSIENGCITPTDFSFNKPEIGEKLFIILDKTNKNIYKVGEDNYNNNSTLPDCKGEVIKKEIGSDKTYKIKTNTKISITKTGSIINFAGTEVKENSNSGNIINLSGNNLAQNYESGIIVFNGKVNDNQDDYQNYSSLYYFISSLILAFVIIGTLVFKLLKSKK